MKNNGFPGAATISGASIYPGLNVILVPSGLDWRTHPAALNIAAELRLPDAFGAGQQRLVACGWEVINSSPVVNMAGSITAYRCPSLKQNSFIGNTFSGPPITFDVRPVEFMSLGPGTQAEATLYTNSRTWAASEGLYQVAALNDITNPFTMPLPGIVGMANIPDAAVLDGDEDRIVFLPPDIYNTATTGALNAASASCAHGMPWDISGCVIRGDSVTDQTYTITVRYYIERIPTTSDPNLLVLATESPPHDPLALEIYSRAMAHLPVAVPVDQNPLGEWFDTVMNVVSSALPAIGTALGSIFPPAAVIGAAGAATARYLRDTNAKAREEEKKDQARKTLKTNTVAVLQSNGSQAQGRPRPKPLPKPPKRRN